MVASAKLRHYTAKERATARAVEVGYRAASLEERPRRQDHAFRTRRAHLNPVIRALLGVDLRERHATVRVLPEHVLPIT